jgi:hypothetical protein
MVIIEITDPRTMALLMETMSNIVGMSDSVPGGLHDLRVGIDRMDNGLKFSVEGSTWSPPYVGVVKGSDR